MTTSAQLPYLDEHATAIAAGIDEVWMALTGTVDRSFSRRPAASYARLIRCADSTASGPRPLTEGSTIPGFRVAAATPGSELVLAGRHRFSTYTLTFRLDRVDAGHSRVRAETRAAFPGAAGRVYRLLVIGTGGHAVGMRRLLAGIRARAESHARTM
ncbi:MAG: hypothetical protein ACQSGP_24835 [Frankia sp.]